MAYPDAIKETGALSNTDDIFEYFKGALRDYTLNPEQWPYSTLGVGDYFIASNGFGGGGFIQVPMNRSTFYDWIDYWTITTSTPDNVVNNSNFYFRTIHGGPLYIFNEVQGNTNWPVQAVKDWGKIKTLEKGIFGSVGNGGDLSATSIIGSGAFQTRCQFMVQNELNYMRYGLSKFSSYGNCHPNQIFADPLILVAQSAANRLIYFDRPSGILLGDCERSFDYGVTWSPITEQPMIVPSGRFETSQIQLRVRRSRGAYIEASDIIYNTIVFP